MRVSERLTGANLPILKSLGYITQLPLTPVSNFVKIAQI